ncbi:hypothetical protein MKK69_23545 [Methylobacterium sp. J-026]|nr:hypothetical protein [Methylobacterium sp. J-026]
MSWSPATVTDAAEKFVAELSPYPTFKAFKGDARGRGRKHPGKPNAKTGDAWITAQKRILRLLAIASEQDQLITSEQHKLGHAVRAHDDIGWWEGKEALLEERLLLDTKQQEKFRLSLPEMVEVAIYGHINPAELWRSYHLSSAMFEAARCAGWCRIGKFGPLSPDGANWLINYLAGWSSLDSTDPDAISRYFLCRDLIIDAFNGLADANIHFLRGELLNEVETAIKRGGPIEIRVPAIIAKQRTG